MNNINRKLIVNAVLDKFLESDWSMLNYGIIKHFAKQADYSIIRDSIVADNEEIYKNIDWQKMNREKILRIITRNKDVANYIDIKSYNFKINEIKYLVVTMPEITEIIGVNFSDISKQEALMLLKSGHEKFLNQINLKKYKFTSLEIYTLLSSFYFNDIIFKKLDTSSLNGYYISNILKNSDAKNIRNVNIDLITPKKWCEILAVKPELFKFCDINKFKNADIYYTIKIIEIIGDIKLCEFIKKHPGYKKEISEFGWVKLLIKFPDEFILDCNCDKLNDSSWAAISYYQPKLLKFKNKKTVC